MEWLNVQREMYVYEAKLPCGSSLPYEMVAQIKQNLSNLM